MIDNKQVHKADETPILFINFRDEEFTGYWNYAIDKKPYVFAPHESKWLPLWLAMHFSKSLVDAEMNGRGLPTDHPSRESFVAKCIGNKPEDGKQDEDPLGIEILNRNKKMESDTVDKIEDKVPAKRGRKPKEKEKSFEGKE